MRLFVRVCLVFNKRQMRGNFEMEKMAWRQTTWKTTAGQLDIAVNLNFRSDIFICLKVNTGCLIFKTIVYILKVA